MDTYATESAWPPRTAPRRVRREPGPAEQAALAAALEHALAVVAGDVEARSPLLTGGERKQR